MSKCLFLGYILLGIIAIITTVQFSIHLWKKIDVSTIHFKYPKLQPVLRPAFALATIIILLVGIYFTYPREITPCGETKTEVIIQNLADCGCGK